MTDPSLVPPRRLGKILSKARSDRGLTLAEVAELTEGEFSHAAVSSIERGTRRVSDDELASLSGLYGVGTTSLIPSRSQLVIDVSEGEMYVNSSHASFAEAAEPTEILSQYLAMVYAMRHISPGTDVPLRIEDLEVLGKALRIGSSTLRSDLDALMSEGSPALSWRTRLLRKRVLLPAAGVLVAMCGVGALVLVQSDGAPTVATSTTPVAVMPATVAPAEIGGAVVQERNADGSEGPVTAVNPTAPATSEESATTSTSSPSDGAATSGAAVVGPSSVETR